MGFLNTIERLILLFLARPSRFVAFLILLSLIGLIFISRSVFQSQKNKKLRFQVRIDYSTPDTIHVFDLENSITRNDIPRLGGFRSLEEVYEYACQKFDEPTFTYILLYKNNLENPASFEYDSIIPHQDNKNNLIKIFEDTSTHNTPS